MRKRFARQAVALLLLPAALLVACSKNDPTEPPPPPPAGLLVSNFSLTDVNPNSATHGQGVSPRQALGKVSAWYFGHAT
jgi:hypothetical protein